MGEVNSNLAMPRKLKSSESDAVVIALARLEEKHDAFTGETREFRDGLRRNLENHNERIVALEKFRWMISGVIAIVAAGGTDIANKIISK